MSVFLELNNLSVYYDKVRAIEALNLTVNKGEIVALIGANGAGKSTTLRAVTGLVKPLSGDVTFNGQPLRGLSSDRIAALGIRMVPEGRRIFPLMSVKDNLMMGAFVRRGPEVQRDLENIYQRFPRLRERQSQLAGTLSGGEQQMVSFGRALMGRPRLLLLDEPSLGLAPQVVREIARAIRSINQEEGLSVVLVEQNSRMALQISHRAYALETGKVRLSGDSAVLRDSDEVRRMYLGVGAVQAAPQAALP